MIVTHSLVHTHNTRIATWIKMWNHEIVRIHNFQKKKKKKEKKKRIYLDHILCGNNKVLNVIEYSAKCTTNFTKLAYKLICYQS